MVKNGENYRNAKWTTARQEAARVGVLEEPPQNPLLPNVQSPFPAGPQQQPFNLPGPNLGVPTVPIRPGQVPTPAAAPATPVAAPAAPARPQGPQGPQGPQQPPGVKGKDWDYINGALWLHTNKGWTKAPTQTPA